MARTQDEGRHPTIFLSYAHDDDVHTSAVLDLATFLETRGFAVAFDVWNTGSRQDWYAWMLREIQTADFVIVVASPRYRAVGDGAAPGDVNRGVQAETAALRDLLYRDRATWLGRVLPVVLPGRSLDELPTFTQPYSASHFVIESISDDGLEELLRVLTGQPSHSRPPRGRIPAPPSGSDAVAAKAAGLLAIVWDAVGKRSKVRVDLWTLFTALTFAATVGSMWLLSEPVLFTTFGICGALVVLAAVRRHSRTAPSAAWKLLTLAVIPSVAAVVIALPDTWAPVLDVTTGASPEPDADSSERSSSPETGSTPTPGSTAATTGHAAPSSSEGGPGRGPTMTEHGPAEQTRGTAKPGEPPGNENSSRDGSLEILAVGHSFSAETDRLTITVRDTHTAPILIEAIAIYMDYRAGHPWNNPDQWNFTVSGDMYAGAPGFDGSQRAHGVVHMDGSGFNFPLVGRGYVYMTRSWRRLLTFEPQRLLRGNETTSIVVDIPTTHLLQQTSPGRPAGPMVEHRFDPREGSLFTRVDLRTPDGTVFACNHLRLPDDKPVCAEVDPSESVELPY